MIYDKRVSDVAFRNKSKACRKISLSSARPLISSTLAHPARPIEEFPSEYFPFSLSLSEKYVFRTVHTLCGVYELGTTVSKRLKRL